jgi:tetratricopeptide (TPR) repeat protein
MSFTRGCRWRLGRARAVWIVAVTALLSVAITPAAWSQAGAVDDAEADVADEPAVSRIIDVDRELVRAGQAWDAVVAEADAAYAAGVRERDAQPRLAREMFELAETGYRRVLDEGGFTSSGLLYNLGNTHAQLNEHGAAIAAYLRARRLEPGNADVQHNLRVVRSRVATRVEGAERGVLASGGGAVAALRPVVWAHRATAGEAKLWVFIVSAALFWGVLGVRLWIGERGGRPWPARRVALVPFAVALAASASLAWEAFGPQAEVAVVVGDEVEARTGPDESYGARFTGALAPGVELLVVERIDDWLRVRLADGRSAFVPRDAVDVIAM